MRVDGLYIIWDVVDGIRAEAEINGERVPVHLSMPRTIQKRAVLRDVTARNSHLTLSNAPSQSDLTDYQNSHRFRV